jgi:hypothetical protein
MIDRPYFEYARVSVSSNGAVIGSFVDAGVVLQMRTLAEHAMQVRESVTIG